MGDNGATLNGSTSHNDGVEYGVSTSPITPSSGVMDDNGTTFDFNLYWNFNDSTNYRDFISSNTNNSEINSFYFFAPVQFTVLWILFFSIVIGNGAVLTALFFNNNRRTRTKYFIMHLALADLLVGLIVVLSDIVSRFIIVWRAGLVACKVLTFSKSAVTYYSTYVLVALSIDRFDAITRPMNFRGSWRKAHLLIGCAWFISALLSLPVSYFYHLRAIQGKLQCWIQMDPWLWKLYMSHVAITIFLIPAIVITYCYAVIVCTIWSKSQILSPARQLDNKGHEDHDIRRSSSRGIIPRAKIKTVKMTFVIVIVFILCWSPYIVFDLLQVYEFIPDTQTNVAIASLIQSLASLNSAANPIIYCLFSTRLCNSLCKIAPFSWLNCCGQENQEPSSCTETLTSSSNRQRSMTNLRGNSTRPPRVRLNNHCYESNHHDALL